MNYEYYLVTTIIKDTFACVALSAAVILKFFFVYYAFSHQAMWYVSRVPLG